MLPIRIVWEKLILAMVLVLTSSCSVPSTMPTSPIVPTTALPQPTAVITSTPTSTPTPMLTVTLIPTLTPDLSTQEPLPTPDLYEKNVETLFIDTIDITCEPVCWHTIQPGASSIADTRGLLRDPFQFEDVNGVLQGYYSTEHPDLYTYGHRWTFDEGRTASGFLFYSQGETFTDTIQAIELFWTGSVNTPTTLQQYPTFQSIFGLFGVPDKIYRDIFRGRWMMVYLEAGIAIPIGSVYSDYQTSDVCFDGSIPSARIFITQPYSNGLEGLSEFQSKEVGDRLQTWRVQTVEESFGLTEAEFVDFVMDDTTVNCLETIDEN